MKNKTKLITAIREAFRNIQAAERIGRTDKADPVTAHVAENAYYYRRIVRELQNDLKAINALPGRDGVPYAFGAIWNGFKQNGFVFEKAELEKALSDYDCNTSELDMLKALTLSAAVIETGLVCSAALTQKSYGVKRLQAALVFMKKAEITDFTLVFPFVSETERLLESSEEHYARMTEATKALYRKQLRRYSKANGVSEKQALAAAVKAAEVSGGCVGRALGVDGRRRPWAYVSVFVLIFAGLIAAVEVLCPFWATLLLLLPMAEVALKSADFIFSMLTRTSPCPALQADMLPQGKLTLTVITALADDSAKSISALERLYLTNGGEGFYFGLLADLPEAEAETDKGDEKLLTEAAERIKSLNLRYGNRFCLFVRRRTENGEGVWNGRERKRGAIEELIRCICGKDGGFLLREGPDITGVPFLLTLDADTSLPPEGVQVLTGMLLHPLNRPVIGRGRVAEGYGIIQPGVQNSLESVNGTRFAAMVAGVGGIEVYESAGFNRRQSVFGTGTFCGKGIIDVKAYAQVLDGVLPKRRILSHDMPEGNILRTRYVSDLCFTDNVPSNVLSYYKRLHRWIRGDVQNLSLLFGYKQGFVGGVRIVHNVLRHILPVLTLATLAAAGLCNAAGRPWICAFALLDIASPVLFTLISGPAALKLRRRSFFSAVKSSVAQSVSVAVYECFALCHKALVTADAVAKSVFRLITGKKLLLWVTAAQAEKSGGKTLAGFVFKLFPSAVVGSLFFFFTKTAPTRLLGLMWFLFPLYAWYLSEKPRKKAALSVADKRNLRDRAKPIWRFFEENVNAHTAWLPPDNIQLAPVEAVAMRTSPTNIGLYLLSVLAAEDFGFISPEETESRLSHALDSMERMKKCRGHFYNWYELKGLAVLGGGYVSTVDSGNLCVCLVALSRALFSSGRAQLGKRCELLFRAADFGFLYNGERNLFSLGFNEASGTLSDICYDLYMSEARSTSYFALAFGQVPVKHWRCLGRPVVEDGGHIGMASWSGTAFEYFMPQLFLPLYRNSFVYESLRFALYEQKRFNRGRLWGCSESAYYCFDAEMNYQYKAHGVQELALMRYAKKEMVLSPYSVYLALCIAPISARKAITAYEQELGTGIYGLYEAVDFSDGGVVHSYMAHHMGMSLLAIANVCFDNIFVRRFMNHPRTAAFYELLQEKIPINASIFNAEKQPQANASSSLRGSFSERLAEYNPAEPVVYVGGSGGNTVVADSCGHVRFSHAGICVNETVFDRFSAARTLNVLFCNGDSVFSAAPYDENGKFSFECAEGYAAHICSSGAFSGRVKYYTDAAGCFITETKSDGGKSYSIIFAFDVQLAEDKEFYAHPAFARLFVTADYDKSTGTLLYSKSTGNGRDEICMAVGLSDPSLPFVFETNKDGYKAFSLYRPTDLTKEMYSCGTGVCVTPFCLIKTPPLGGGEARLIISVGKSRDEALDRLNSSRNMRPAPVGRSVFGERENPVLAGIFYGRERFESEAAVSENALWRYGVSGDYPITAVRVREYYRHDILFYVGVFKRLATLNVRTELVFLVCDEEKYSSPNENALKALLREEKCGGFVGKRGGIFIVDGNDRDTVAVFKGAAVCFTESFDTPFSARQDRRFARPLPPILRRHGVARLSGGRTVGGGAYDKDGFTVDKGDALRLPFSYILAGKAFGSVVTHSTLGYSFCGNSALRKIAAFAGDIYGGTDTGEVLYLFGKDGIYDLTACSTQVRYEHGVATYSGTADGADYTLRVFVCERLPLKALHLRFEGGYEGRTAFSVTPLMGSGAVAGGVVNRVVLNASGCTSLGFSCPKSTFFGSYVGAVGCVGNGKRFLGIGELLNGEQSGIEDRAAVSHSGNDAVYFLGAAPSAEAMVRVLERFIASGVRAEEEKAAAFARQMLPPIELISDYNALNAMFNVFAPYQVAACRFFARAAFYQSGGAYGFRDQLQDCLYLVYSMPKIVRTHLLRCAARQYTDGSVQHWWHSCVKDGLMYGVKTRCSDDFLWLPLCIAEYVEITGDRAILSLEIPYLQSAPLGEERERYEAAKPTAYRESLYRHCVKALEHGKRYGAHGLPLIGSCDWNDAFSGLGDGAESVFCAFFYSIALRRFAPLARLFGDVDFAKECLEEAQRVLNRAEECYNGDRFVRAYTEHGIPLGTDGRAACEIDLLVQSFATLADADVEKCRKALMTAYERLYDGENRLAKLFYPPFGRDTEYAGYINAYAKGVRENGGQYTHAAVWFAAALAKLGFTDRAMKVIEGINPLQRAEDRVLFSRYKAEPYAIAADIYTARGQLGRGGWTHYTGAAAWFCKTVFELLCGIKISNGLITVTPLFEYRLRLTLCGEVLITARKGARPTVDGKPLTFPYRLDGNRHELIIPLTE